MTATRIEIRRGAAGETASTQRLAFDRGLVKLERRLRRIRKTAREAKRRPKMYYAASR